MLKITICKVCKTKFPHPASSYRVHCSRKCYTQIGNQNPKWRGGYVIRKGYRYVFNPLHPSATKKGYVLEHRLVAEKVLSRFLKKKEVVHHLNHNKLDNRASNLAILSSLTEHNRIHNHPRNRKGRYC